MLATRKPLWLTARVRIYTRYQLPRGRGKLSAAFYWLLALGGLAFLGWIFFTSGQPGKEKPVAPAQRSPAHAPAIIPTQAVAPAVPTAPQPVRNWLETQVALARLGFSCGSIDGVGGYQTRAALRAFQTSAGLPVSGRLDTATQARLRLDAPLLTRYTLTTNDVARLLPLSPTWLGKSEQARLDYESVLELVAETSWSNPALIRQLNPQVNWDAALPGLTVWVPNVRPPAVHGHVVLIRILLSAKSLEAFDAASNVVLHCPCSIARQVEKRPMGTLHVVTVVHHPTYTFNPEIFPESAEARRLDRKLLLPAGPNNPVGSAWIGLDRPGYGIHGTPLPENVGRTESHGCFRLANWNAEFLAQQVSPGTPVDVEP